MIVKDYRQVTPEPAAEAKPCRKRVSIGVAYDRAFHFYYPDNLDELALRGGELVWFSPLEERKLPEGLGGIYLGGGYPEEYAEVLSDNEEMKEAIRQFASRGLPIYAECGGLMYLTRGIETTNEERYPMVGILPAWSRMLDRLKSLGYVEITQTANSLWGFQGTGLRGHEFHYSDLDQSPSIGPVDTVYAVDSRKGGDHRAEGYQINQTLGSYIHLHLGSRPESAHAFAAACRNYRNHKEAGHETP